MANRKYSDELKHRAVRLALEQKPRPIAQVARDLGVEGAGGGDVWDSGSEKVTDHGRHGTDFPGC